MGTEIQEIYDKWWDSGGDEQRDVRLRFAALCLTLIESGALDNMAYQKQWRTLMENNLAQIGNNLKKKPNRKESKSPFHPGIFSRFKRLIFGRFIYNVVTK
jgi:hypothetical protein